MKKYPFVKQPYQKDCGVSCLSMIIKYYKGNVPISKLRSMSKTTNEGTTAFHLLEAANNLGFTTSGIKCEIEDIENLCPCIAFVTIDKIFNHYVVIYKIDLFKKEITIADPSKGITTMNFESFKTIWNNVILSFKLINKPPIYKNHSILNYFKKWVMPYKKPIIYTLILSFSIVTFSICASFFLEKLLKYSNHINLVCLIFLLDYLLKTLITYFRNNIFINITTNIDCNITNDIFSKIIDLPYLSFCNKKRGEYISRMSDLSNVRNIITNVFINLIVDIVVSIISLFILFYLNQLLTFVALFLLLILFVILYIFHDKICNIINSLKIKNDIVSTIMVESISGYETIKGINIEKYIKKDFKSNYLELIDDSVKYQKLINKEQFIKEAIYNIFYVLIIFLGFKSVIINVMPIGEFLTYNTLLTFFLNPINDFFNLDYSIKEAYASMKRIMELEEEEVVKKGDKGLVSKSIYFFNVNYIHMDKYKILENVNFSIREGEKVVILGSSGSGKSTLLKMLAKKYPANDKQIYIGSVDINECNMKDFNSNISYISQNETLFTKSIYDNITLGQTVPDDKLQEVMNVCCLNELLVNKHMNLFSFLEDNGNNLSGGERQIVILARTLLKNTKIVLIDEGLNQLDVYLERKILNNLFSFYKNKTFIVVSHRFDNIDLFTHLLQMDKGKLVNDILKEDSYAT